MKRSRRTPRQPAAFGFENTNPIGIADAYRAAGRVREAQTLERTASACCVPESTSEITQELVNAVRALQSLREHARSLGLFADLRDLLACGMCGLEEDVLLGGNLITHEAGERKPVDAGLRFKEESDGWFRCPRCGCKVKGVGGT